MHQGTIYAVNAGGDVVTAEDVRRRAAYGAWAGLGVSEPGPMG